MADRPPASRPHPEYVSYTSEAYGAVTETEVEESTAAWLETQAAMPLIRDVADRTFELMRLRPGATVLDVGCGTGVMLPALAEAVDGGGHVTGIDHSHAFLARAHRRLSEAGLDERVSLVHGDALALPFPDDSFDVVHSERLLMHLDEPDEAIREMVRVTRPGGRVACAEVFASGVEFDHPDRQVMDLLCQTSVAQIRNPAMGIELRRRLLAASLEEVTAVACADVETYLDDDEIEEFRRQARALADRGLVESQRAEAAVDHLVAVNAAGTYTGLALVFIAAGTVPGSNESPEPAPVTGPVDRRRFDEVNE